MSLASFCGDVTTNQKDTLDVSLHTTMFFTLGEFPQHNKTKKTAQLAHAHLSGLIKKLIALNQRSVLLEVHVSVVGPHGVRQRRPEQEHLMLVPLVLQPQPEMIITFFFSSQAAGIIHAVWVAMKNAHLIIDNTFQSQKSRRRTKTSNGSFMI